ncbi:hypothetical protein [Mesorhizobium sp. ANAO-SY3R2]|uniref:hypothetical protein n=1 Tax=Mesorhizobium sp. ANAO-SY3R2 TaxID=3166644 RepID=UPI00366BF449
MRLRNSGDPARAPDIDDAVMSLSVAAGITKQDVIGNIIRDWLDKRWHLSVGTLDDSETGGA